MNKCKKKKPNEKNAAFGVWMPREELAALDEKAEVSGMSRNMLLRRSAAGNIAIVNTRELRWVMEELVAMHRESGERIERLACLVEQALAQGWDGHGEPIRTLLDECVQLKETRGAIRVLVETAGNVLAAMSDDVKDPSRINR